MAAGPLRHHPGFRRLLVGAVAGQAAAQLSLVALPLAAVVELRASAFEAGLLTATETAAFLLIGLPAGAWLDRVRRMPVLVRSDLVRAAAIGSVPLAAAAGMLTMPQLYLVSFVVGVATVFFDVSHQSVLPRLLAREHLVSGNGALESVRGTTAVATPAVGGGLVQALGASAALALNAVGYLLSALVLRRIRLSETPSPAAGRGSLRAEIAEGLSFVVRQPLLRPIMLCTAVANFFGAMLAAVQTVYLVRELGLTPGLVGVVLSAMAVGGLVAALLAGRLARAAGDVRVIWLAMLGTVPAAVLLPMGRGTAGALCFTAGLTLLSFRGVLYNVAQVSLRQRICPDHLLGRMNATLRFVVWGCMPLGAIAGAVVAGGLGTRTAVAVGAAGLLTALVPLSLSPLRRMRDLPAERVPESSRD
ncbi:MFS transporter [Pseudosporangium ferrugineum]|uniref:Putative MFS family arabinose efflux permease n=1 Tax=Pseudosporangium ferrugineum TaxID=439699 RepID=A0A2T0SB82_9ACTN|nr:MFS transporter [Pseudosporangium ferrugineum]PRY30680.1 putative MFS family arabinose efflux permease [Pseudosporangium ferrugineum]